MYDCGRVDDEVVTGNDVLVDLQRLQVELNELHLRWQVVGRSGRPHDPANVCAGCDIASRDAGAEKSRRTCDKDACWHRGSGLLEEAALDRPFEGLDQPHT